MTKDNTYTKHNKVVTVVLKGSQTIRQKVADACEVKVSTVNRWIREETDELNDVRVLSVISRETTIPFANLVEIQNSEKVA